MKTYQFKLEDEDSLIIVKAALGNDRLSLALGITRHNIEICSYDFFSNDVLWEIHGVLGLDFFKNTDLLISFKRFEIVVS
jgi:hypothetical protein